MSLQVSVSGYQLCHLVRYLVKNLTLYVLYLFSACLDYFNLFRYFNTLFKLYKFQIIYFLPF